LTWHGNATKHLAVVGTEEIEWTKNQLTLRDVKWKNERKTAHPIYVVSHAFVCITSWSLTDSHNKNEHFATSPSLLIKHAQKHLRELQNEKSLPAGCSQAKNMCWHWHMRSVQLQGSAFCGSSQATDINLLALCLPLATSCLANVGSRDCPVDWRRWTHARGRVLQPCSSGFDSRCQQPGVLGCSSDAPSRDHSCERPQCGHLWLNPAASLRLFPTFPNREKMFPMFWMEDTFGFRWFLLSFQNIPQWNCATAWSRLNKDNVFVRWQKHQKCVLSFLTSDCMQWKSAKPQLHHVLPAHTFLSASDFACHWHGDIKLSGPGTSRQQHPQGRKACSGNIIVMKAQSTAATIWLEASTMAKSRQRTAKKRQQRARKRQKKAPVSSSPVGNPSFDCSQGLAFVDKRTFFNASGHGYEALIDVKNSDPDLIDSLKLGPLPPFADRLEPDLVFCSSTICQSVCVLGFGHFESIHRTACGKLVLEKTICEDESVICGGFKIQDAGGRLQAMGEFLEFSFLEAAEANLKRMCNQWFEIEEEEEETEMATSTDIVAFKTMHDDCNWRDASN